MNQDEISTMKKYLEEKFNTLQDMSTQQRSGHNSDLIKQMLALEEKLDTRMDGLDAKITSLEKELSSWQLGSKIGIIVLVAIGGIITWVINTLGIKIGIK